MRIGKLCNKRILLVPKELSLHQAMCLAPRTSSWVFVVVEHCAESHWPVGVVFPTDIMAPSDFPGKSSDQLSLADMMDCRVSNATEDDELSDALGRMHRWHARNGHIAVFDKQGRLSGVLSHLNHGTESPQMSNI